MCFNSLRSGKKAALFLNSILSELQNKSVKNMLSTLNWNFDGIHDKEKFTVPNLPVCAPRDCLLQIHQNIKYKR